MLNPTYEQRVTATLIQIGAKPIPEWIKAKLYKPKKDPFSGRLAAGSARALPRGIKVLNDERKEAVLAKIRQMLKDKWSTQDIYAELNGRGEVSTLDGKHTLSYSSVAKMVSGERKQMGIGSRYSFKLMKKISDLRDEGCSNDEIGEKINMPGNIIANILQRFENRRGKKKK